jgi:hypothetical protein
MTARKEAYSKDELNPLLLVYPTLDNSCFLSKQRPSIAVPDFLPPASLNVAPEMGPFFLKRLLAVGSLLLAEIEDFCLRVPSWPLWLTLFRKLQPLQSKFLNPYASR